MSAMNSVVKDVTDRIIERSRETRESYLSTVRANRPTETARNKLTPGNQAHAYAGCALKDRTALMGASWPNIGIITSYNDMLSAHAPYERYPDLIREACREVGATAQVAGGVPAMCDGVTQGQVGMELSLFSRDVIAMGTAVGLSHDTYDAALYLGVCDKIVPGLLIGALQYGHIPGLFVPAGPMPSGLPNKEKVRIRQLFAEGKIDRAGLLEAELKSYHSQGTCTFYGTANSNQMMIEVAGLHLPGAAFINPGNALRDELTKEAARQAVNMTMFKDNYTPIGEIVDEKSVVNMIVGLMATGGSTNHTLHIPAIARAAGVIVNWDDFDALSKVTPLLTRIYPNGEKDVNHFHAAGGMGYLIRECLDAGLMHDDVQTVMGKGLYAHSQEPVFTDGKVEFRDSPKEPLDDTILRPVSNPFKADGGLAVLDGELGRGVMKISAVDEKHHVVTAPAMVFEDQNDVAAAFKAGELEKDVVVVLRFQGPRANGMPELHKLSSALGILQDRGFKVALVTDGRLSGASGKFPSAIHVGPEALSGGNLARVKDGDMITLDAKKGVLTIDAPDLEKRIAATRGSSNAPLGLGRDLFSIFRDNCVIAEMGGGIIG